MSDRPALPAWCGIDSVRLERVERFLQQTPPEDLLKLFSREELADAGNGHARIASLAARFAAKEACLKLFPRETALGRVSPGDFSVERNNFGAPAVVAGPRARYLLGLYRLDKISLSLTHDAVSASAIAIPNPAATRPSLAGRLIYHLLPIRRGTVMANLRRVFGGRVSDDEIVRIAQAYYAHVARFLGEFIAFPFMPAAARARRARVENEEAILRAAALGRGVLVLTGHFGNWEFTVASAIAHFPQYRDRFYFLRRPLNPPLLDTLVVRRFERAGIKVIPKRGSLDSILERLAACDAVVFILDQHAGGRDGVRVDFFGTPASTFRSLAIIALTTGAPVVPAAAFRDGDGRHVLRFEEALPAIILADHDEAIRANTQAYNDALEALLLRHPEQWFWMHRRWKDERGRAR